MKSVTPKLSSEAPNLEPTPNYDCHMSRSPASSSVTDLATLMRSTQVQYHLQYQIEANVQVNSKQSKKREKANSIASVREE